MTTDTPATADWSAVEENMELITGIEKAVRQLVHILPPHIADALGWVNPGVSAAPEATARAAILAYQELRDGGYEPQEALECAVSEVLEGLAVDPAAVRAEMAGTVQVDALSSEGWAY